MASAAVFSVSQLSSLQQKLRPERWFAPTEERVNEIPLVLSQRYELPVAWRSLRFKVKKKKKALVSVGQNEGCRFALRCILEGWMQRNENFNERFLSPESIDIADDLRDKPDWKWNCSI